MLSITDQFVVLIAEDEKEVADLYSVRLDGKYGVRTAYDGNQAWDMMDGDVDVALIDRRMPGLSGGELLDKIRLKGYDCRVAMVTAVDPHYDVAEMGFDEYLTKPVGNTEMKDVVDSLITRSNYDQNLQDYISLLSRKSVLEEEMNHNDLQNSEQYQNLTSEITDKEKELIQNISDMSYEDLRSVLREFAEDVSKSRTEDIQ